MKGAGERTRQPMVAGSSSGGSVDGRTFYKMTGSGNDFVIFDARVEAPGELQTVERIRALCARGTGVGADGVVFLERSSTADYLMRYFNSDGSRASLCGNASLCSARLAVDLGMVSPEGFTFESDAGLLQARVRDGEPEIDFEPVTIVRDDAGIPKEKGEQGLGFALAGVPHLVAACADVEAVELERRGARLRHDPGEPEGANVNFVSPEGDHWNIRTFERGVEGETLACGTGAVASAILLTVWGKASGPVVLRTRSGRSLTVTLRRDGSRWLPSLLGEGRLVFRGELAAV